MSFLYKELPPQARGDTWSFTFLIQDVSGNPLDITGNQYWFTIKSDIEALDINAEAQVGPISPTDAVNGEVIIIVPATQTDSLVTGILYNYDLQEITSTSEVNTLIIGRVKVVSDVTRFVP